MDKRKYDYWHLIIDVGKDCPKLKEGMMTEYPVIHNGWVLLIDEQGNLLRDTYKLQYLGRAKKGLTKEELIKRLDFLKEQLK